MGLPLSQTPFDADAYLAWEAEQADKSEYVAGKVFAMVPTGKLLRCRNMC